MSLFRGIDFENLEDGEYIQFFGVHMLSWGDIERATGIKPTIAFIEDDTLEKQIADLVAALDELLKSQKALMQNNNLDNLAEDMFRVTNAVVKAEQALAQVKGMKNAR